MATSTQINPLTLVRQRPDAWQADRQSREYLRIMEQSLAQQKVLLDGVSAKDGLFEVTPETYGAVGNGVTLDDAAVAAAISAAVSANRDVYWFGTYAVSGHIDNFHSVRHVGPGSIVRGTDTWVIEPESTQTQKLYVATTGSDSNDGLTSDHPFLTLQAAFDAVLSGSGGYIRGRQEFHLAAGTYVNAIDFSSLTGSVRPLYVFGPTQGHPNVPTAIIDGATDTETTGFQVRQQVWVIVEDLKVINYATGFSNNGGLLTLNNCHTDACTTAIIGQHGAFTAVKGGDYDGNSDANSNGYRGLYNATHDLLVTSLSDAATFHDFGRGIFLQEGAQGHLDFTKVHDCTTAGLELSRGCGAANTKQMQIYRNAIGVLVENTGWFNNNIDFGSGGNANTVNIREMNSPELDFRANDNTSRTIRSLDTPDFTISHTGTTAQTLVWTPLNGRVHHVSEAGDITELRIMCEGTALLGTCNFDFFTWDGSTEDFMGGIQVPIGEEEWVVEADIYNSNPNAQRCIVKSYGKSGVLGVDYNTGAQVLTNTAFEYRVKLTLSNAADTINFRVASCRTTIGG